MCLIPFVPLPLPPSLPLSLPPSHSASSSASARLGGASRQARAPVLYCTHGISRESASPRLDVARRPWAIALPSLRDATRRDAARRGAARRGEERHDKTRAARRRDCQKREAARVALSVLRNALWGRVRARCQPVDLSRVLEESYRVSYRLVTYIPTAFRTRMPGRELDGGRERGEGRGGPWPPSKMKVKADGKV